VALLATVWSYRYPDLYEPDDDRRAGDVQAAYGVAVALDPAAARPALLEMLDDCLAGYAVFPGSDGRRDLFNWFLVEAVPAAWSERLPDRIYTLKWPWPPSS
jgi:hypothetical protein